MCRVLALEPDVVEPVSPAAPPPPDSELHDARSGLRVRPGLLTAIVSDQPDDSALLADRLGLCAAEQDDEVSLGGVPLTSLRHADVRERIMVSDTGAALFAGRLADRIDERGNGDVEKALFTASAEDILEALPEGLDSVVTETGRSFSGGQRQRLVLARALAADPEILVLVEPTSAVDAHTEARIADRLRAHRDGSHHGRHHGRARCCWTRSTRWPSWSTAGSSPSAPTRSCWRTRYRAPYRGRGRARRDRARSSRR